MSLAPKKYDSMVEAVNSLTKRGYTFEFRLEEDCLICHPLDKRFRSSDLLITEVYRFEGISDPEDSSVIYAIESKDGVKGVLIDAYGAYADEQKEIFLKDIPVRNS